jgi:hypothetical protein
VPSLRQYAFENRLSPALIILGVGLGLIAPWLVGGKVLAPFDLASQMLQPLGPNDLPLVHNHFVLDGVTHHIPYRTLSEKAFQEDGHVGWNPLQFGGTAQNANTMVLNYEWSTQLNRFLDFWSAWHIGKMLNFLTAGLGMLLFLSSQGCRGSVALMGAIAFMLNTQFVVWIFFNPGLAGFGWMPLLLWALYAARDGNSNMLAAAAVFLALAILGSTVQQLAFLVIALLCVWLGWWRDASFSRAFLNKATVAFLIVGTLAAGLSAFMLEPTIAAFFENSRAGHSRGGVLYPEGALQPFLNIGAMLFTPYPFVLGSAQTLDLGKALKLSFSTLGFFGTVPVVVALVSLFSKRVPTAAKLLMLAGSLIPLTPLVGLLYHRINLLWILGGCWGASVWLSTANEEAIRLLARRLWWGLSFLCATWLVASVALVAARPWVEPMLQDKVIAMAGASLFGMFPEWMKMRVSSLFEYLCIWNPWHLTALAGVVLSTWGLTRLASSRWWEAMATPLGVAVQLVLFWFQWTPWTSPEMPYTKHPLVAVLQDEVGSTGRLAQEDFPWGGGYFDPNMLAPAGVAVTRGYDAIQPHGMKSPTGLPWDFPGSTHFLGKIGNRAPVGWMEVWSDGEWWLLRRPEQVVGSILLENGQEPLLREQFARPTLNTMEAEAPAGATGLTLFSNWHRGWRWKDGGTGVWKRVECSPIRGVEVVFDKPLAADSKIYFRFDPAPPVWVLVVTGMSFLGVAWVAMFMRMKMG